MADIGPPTTPASAVAVMNDAIVRARSAAGNHCVRYSTMPGKNPASARPSTKRIA